MLSEDYFQINQLAGEASPWLPRLNQIRKIIQKPDFQYSEEDGADFMLTSFLGSSYWLDKELFNENYLYRRKFKGLHTAFQEIHFQMVDIGALLLKKGFPLEYEPSIYRNQGPDQLASYVKAFVKQCHERYNLFYKKIAHKNQIQPTKDFQKING
ncbi:MAG: hypothetical protein J6Y03_03850 [Alphaproteobacteria bacterium]|nr:hypothetical protein [Alphaproteobacteria bacterium]